MFDTVLVIVGLYSITVVGRMINSHLNGLLIHLSCVDGYCSNDVKTSSTKTLVSSTTFQTHGGHAAAFPEVKRAI